MPDRYGELTSAEEQELRARDPKKFRVYAKTQVRLSVALLIVGVIAFFVVPDDWQQFTGWHYRWYGLLLAGVGIVALIHYGWRLRGTKD